jgi:hypothetical protein
LRPVSGGFYPRLRGAAAAFTARNSIALRSKLEGASD